MNDNPPCQSPLKWYAICTNSRAEKKVHSNLLSDGFESFLPLVTTVRQWSDRKKKVQLPLIPGYIFVKTNQNNLTSVLPVNGVRNILKHLGKPAVIQDEEIENLRILLEDTEKISVISNVRLKKGDAIIVEKGVFKGLVADCVKLKGKHRIIVRIEALVNLLEVNIPLSYVKKLRDQTYISKTVI